MGDLQVDGAAARTTGAKRTGTAAPVARSEESARKELTREQKAELAVRQLYVEYIDEEGSLMLPPILRGQTHMAGSRSAMARHVLALYRKYPNGKAPVEKLWEALRSSLDSDDKYLTDMTDEALVDMFGGKTVSLDDAVAALRNARLKFAFQPDLYNFNSYRQETTFYPPPASAGIYEKIAQMPYFKNLQKTREYEAMEKMLGQKKAEEELKKIALTLLWSKFIKWCSDVDIDLKGLRMKDEVVAARLGGMVLRVEEEQRKSIAEGERKLDAEQVKAEVAFLRKLSEADFWKRIEAKRDAARRPDISLQGIDLTNDRVWEAFVKEFFGGRKDLSASEIQEALKNMSAQNVAEKLAALKKLSEEEKRKETQASAPPGNAAPQSPR